MRMVRAFGGVGRVSFRATDSLPIVAKIAHDRDIFGISNDLKVNAFPFSGMSFAGS
jgi:hypothetical protein